MSFDVVNRHVLYKYRSLRAIITSRNKRFIQWNVFTLLHCLYFWKDWRLQPSEDIIQLIMMTVWIQWLAGFFILFSGNCEIQGKCFWTSKNSSTIKRQRKKRMIKGTRYNFNYFSLFKGSIQIRFTTCFVIYLRIISPFKNLKL